MTQDIRTIAVLGAGTMGQGIAHVAATGGFETHLFDVDSEILHRAQMAIHRNLDKGVDLGKLEAQTASDAKGRLHLDHDHDMAVRAAELIIEAVPENMDLKVKIFERSARSAPASAIFASNTSALSITEMATATGRPEKFAGMHFFNPVHLMKLVELVRGLETSDHTLKTLHAVAEQMGKQVVTVTESPGFVTSRINALIGNEAFNMLESGVATAKDIDTALKLGLNHPMGPFEMVDLVGLDVRLSILQHLHQTLGGPYRPSNLLVQYVKAGRLGRKVGKGVYDYDEDGKIID